MTRKVGGTHKGINVLTHIKTFIPLRGPFKKLNCLDDNFFARTKSTNNTKSIKPQPSKSTKRK